MIIQIEIIFKSNLLIIFAPFQALSSHMWPLAIDLNHEDRISCIRKGSITVSTIELEFVSNSHQRAVRIRTRESSRLPF